MRWMTWRAISAMRYHVEEEVGGGRRGLEGGRAGHRDAGAALGVERHRALGVRPLPSQRVPVRRRAGHEVSACTPQNAERTTQEIVAADGASSRVEARRVPAFAVQGRDVPTTVTGAL